jgi:uncharacterized protein YodC (DUF2158 family)
MEITMTFAAGEVVILKSGGIPMTVIAIDDEDAVCVWTGEEGDLFRESIPLVALQAAHLLDEEDEDEEESENDEEENNAEDEDEDEHKSEAGEKKAKEKADAA